MLDAWPLALVSSRFDESRNFCESGVVKLSNNHNPNTPPTPSAPGPRGHALLGNIAAMQRDPLAFVTSLPAYGDVVRYRLAPLQVHFLNHPDYIKHVLQDNAKNYTKNLFDYDMLRWVVGNGLLTSEGAFWLRQRRLMQPAFHRQRIAALGALIVSDTSAMLDGWDRHAARGQPLDIATEMMHLTLRVVGEALFGTNISTEATSIGQAFTEISINVISRIQSLGLLPPVLPTQRDRAFRAARHALDEVVGAIIRARRRTGEDTGDLLSMLLLARDEETGAGMDDRQVRDEVTTLLLAGHETTANTMIWAWYLLAQHPAVEAKLHDELTAVLAGRPATIDDLPRLRYTRQVIDETLRLYPAAPFFGRRVIAADLIGGYAIPARSAVLVSPFTMHRHPAFWPDPERFDPTRFASEQTERPRFAYFPFSGGPRQCIGNVFALTEAQLILATVAQRYRLRLAPGQRAAPEALITLRPRGGLTLLLEARAA